MKLDITGRQGGKTYRMVQWVLEVENGIILVADAQRADALLRQYEDKGLERKHILLPHQFQNQTYRGQYPRPQIGVDDALDVLQALAGSARIARVSMTPPSWATRNDKENQGFVDYDE